jgi:hypothetical protein
MDDNGSAQSDSEPFMPAFSGEHGLHGYDVSGDQQDVQVEFGFRFTKLDMADHGCIPRVYMSY